MNTLNVRQLLCFSLLLTAGCLVDKLAPSVKVRVIGLPAAENVAPEMCTNQRALRVARRLPVEPTVLNRDHERAPGCNLILAHEPLQPRHRGDGRGGGGSSVTGAAALPARSPSRVKLMLRTTGLP